MHCTLSCPPVKEGYQSTALYNYYTFDTLQLYISIGSPGRAEFWVMDVYFVCIYLGVDVVTRVFPQSAKQPRSPGVDE